MADIYKVARTDDKNIYDAYVAHVVVASSESAAITICADNAADEGAAAWYKADIQSIGVAHEDVDGAKIILSYFNAG